MLNRTIKLTKKFNFDMAHALFGHDGQCKNIHGHTYQLEITVEGIPQECHGATNDGMVMDFGVLKSLVSELIINKLDHALVLNKNAPYANNVEFLQQFEKVNLLPFQPTCENLVLFMVDILIDKFDPGINLYSVRLDETPTSYAVWINDK